MYTATAFLHQTQQDLGQCEKITDSKVHGANMGPIWGRQDPGRSHVGPMNFVIWGTAYIVSSLIGQEHGDWLTDWV